MQLGQQFCVFVEHVPEPQVQRVINNLSNLRRVASNCDGYHIKANSNSIRMMFENVDNQCITSNNYHLFVQKHDVCCSQ